MKKNLKISLIVAGIGAIAYAAYTYFKKQISLLQNYEYKIVAIRYKKFASNVLTFDVVTRFINKSNIEVEVNKIFLDVFVEGVKVGFISENKKFLIPAKGQSDIDLQFSFSPQVVLKNVVDILLSGTRRKDLNFMVKGYADIQSGFVKATVPVEFSDVVSAYI